MHKVGYHERTEVVAPSTIAALMDKCPKHSRWSFSSDRSCIFSAVYLGGTMLGGATRHYTWDGELVVYNPNTRTNQVACKTCGREWVITQTGDNIETVEEVVETV